MNFSEFKDVKLIALIILIWVNGFGIGHFVFANKYMPDFREDPIVENPEQFEIHIIME